MKLARFVLPAFCLAISVGFAARASAQVAGGLPGNFPGLGFSPFGNGMPTNGMMPGMNGVSPQQFNSMMGMRMLQGMGGFHGVQTGVANPFMNGGFGGQPELYYDGPASSKTSGGSASGTSKSGSHSKRDAARAQRAEEKRMAAAAKAKPKAQKVAKKSRPPKDQQ